MSIVIACAQHLAAFVTFPDDRGMSAGVFVTTLGAISKFGGVSGAIFSSIFYMIKGFASIKKIQAVYNAKVHLTSSCFSAFRA